MATMNTIKLGNTTASREFLSLRDNLEKDLMNLDWFVRKMDSRKGVYLAEDEYTELSEWFGITDHVIPLDDAESVYKIIKWASLALIEKDETKIGNINKMVFEISRTEE